MDGPDTPRTQCIQGTFWACLSPKPCYPAPNDRFLTHLTQLTAYATLHISSTIYISICTGNKSDVKMKVKKVKHNKNNNGGNDDDRRNEEELINVSDPFFCAPPRKCNGWGLWCVWIKLLDYVEGKHQVYRVGLQWNSRYGERVWVLHLYSSFLLGTRVEVF